MSTYTPDRWVVVDIAKGEQKVRKVLGGWYGGYAKADTWRLNSGVKEVVEEDDFFLFFGYSGSVYRCHKKAEGTSMLTASILSQLMDEAASKPEYTVELVTPFKVEKNA